MVFKQQAQGPMISVKWLPCNIAVNLWHFTHMLKHTPVEIIWIKASNISPSFLEMFWRRFRRQMMMGWWWLPWLTGNLGLVTLVPSIHGPGNLGPSCNWFLFDLCMKKEKDLRSSVGEKKFFVVHASGAKEKMKEIGHEGCTFNESEWDIVYFLECLNKA